MAPKAVMVGAAVLALTVVTTVVTAQSGCTSVIMSMASCLNYVSGTAAKPSTSCCSALANVVKNQPRCLCTIVNGGGSSLGVSINQTLALGLPKVCNIDTPPASRCNVVNGPAISPVGSPESAPPESSDAGSPASPSVAGSKITPTDGSTTSKGSISKINLLGQIIILFTASYASAAFNFF